MTLRSFIIATDGGLPSAADVRRMTHGSGSLPRGSFGLTIAQAEAIEGLCAGHQMWLEWPELEDGSVVPLQSKYRHVPISGASDWRQPLEWNMHSGCRRIAVRVGPLSCDARNPAISAFAAGPSLPVITFVT